MARKKIDSGRLQARCPSCGRTLKREPVAGTPAFPFCSVTCRLADLDKWLEGEHRIPGSSPGSSGDRQQSSNEKP